MSRRVWPTLDRLLVLCALAGCLALLFACGAARASKTTAPGIAPELGTVTDPGRPVLVLRPFPRLGLASFAGLVVTWRAELQGREDERFYCPQVVWIWPDETEHSQESDCTPWSEHTADDYERSWTMRIRLPPGPPDGWTFKVQLRKGGRVIAQTSGSVLVH